jgi:pyruvate dehydrogenase phosphatase
MIRRPLQNIARQTTRAYSSKTSPTSPTSTALISLGFILAAGGAYYYETRATAYSNYPSTFSIRIRNKDYSYNRKTDTEIEAILTEHEDAKVIQRPGNPVTRWDRNWVGSNEPCEDRSAIDLVQRSSGVTQTIVQGDRDIGLFSIMDGHAGDATSKLLAKVLHPTLTLTLAGLQAGSTSTGSNWNPFSWFAKAKPWTPSSVSETIQRA